MKTTPILNLCTYNTYYDFNASIARKIIINTYIIKL